MSNVICCGEITIKLIILITIEAIAKYLYFLQIKIASPPDKTERNPPKNTGEPILKIDNASAMILNAFINTPEA